ncbi:MAG TPA: HD domain-containing protein [Candidatus Omnitrophota bacterium]|nr:HD domain-containing protein [Candidatus Omnitrophota bacterium]HPT07882.1 HD domain-containing protein [Candidatus Omnitrophota bacterium]
MEFIEAVSGFLKDFLASLQTAKIYETRHPSFAKSLEKTFASLTALLAKRSELIIGLVGDEIAVEKEVFFDLSKLLLPAIRYLRERGIERITFLPGVSKEELGNFIALVALPKKDFAGDTREYFLQKQITHIDIGKLKASGGDPASVQQGHALVFDDASEHVSQSVSSILESQAVDGLALKFSLASIVEGLAMHHQEFMKLATVKRYDEGTSVHLLNVAILSMHLSSKLGFSRNEVLDLGIAALYHDIGKIFVSRKIIRKQEQLTSAELAVMKSHPVRGAELLLQYVESFGILPVVVAFEHHLKYNGGGYPHVAHPRKPHLASMIVTLCDVYDALSQRRGYKADYSPDIIYKLMSSEKGTAFEPGLLERFYQVMGVWPVGSIVALNDKRIAVVEEENEDDIFAPKVRVISDRGAGEYINLKRTNKILSIERFLNPWTEGKAYVAAVATRKTSVDTQQL